MGEIVVGTSSWADTGFVEQWYPSDLPARGRLSWYARHFRAVEVNSSFYAIPEQETALRWVEETPDGFVFDIKLHRLLSRHAADTRSLPPDLRETVETNERGRVRLTGDLERAMIERTLEAIAPLEQADRLGALLLQLTPGFSPERHELAELDPIIEGLAPRPVAVEFRHRGWVSERRVEETLSYLSERSAVFVAVDAPREVHVPIMPPLDAVTRDDLAYMRIHGRNADGYMRGKTVAERFGWRYSDEELEEIEGRVDAMAESANVIHVMFNNNRGADAPTAAQRFRDMIGQARGRTGDTGPQQRIF